MDHNLRSMPDAEEEYFTEGQSMTLSISVRVAAFVSLCCASYMAVKSYQNRHLIFHRLMLGLSLHLIMYCCWSIYGTSAVPYQEDAEFNVWGARGTTSTCTAQGFFAQLGQAVAFYYVGLSFYSFQAVRFNFQIEKYRWVEHCIHIFVNLWAFGSAIYLLTIEAYNPSKHSICYIHSRPLACGKRLSLIYLKLYAILMLTVLPYSSLGLCT